MLFSGVPLKLAGFKGLGMIGSLPSSISTRLVPQSPLPFWRGLVLAMLAVTCAAGVRWAVEPLTGPSLSFTLLFPAVLVATLAADATGAVISVLAGAAASPLVSLASGLSLASRQDIGPGVIVWLAAGTLVALLSLALRRSLVRLSLRERELVAANDRLQLITRELEHRGRNALAIVQGVSSMTARSVGSVEEYRLELAGRLRTLSNAYSQLVRPIPEGAPLRSLVADILSPFCEQVRIIGGPDVVVPETACVAFSLALHELATNAVKYGALSSPEGRVTVRWDLSGGMLDFAWDEAGGPPPARRREAGFGSTLINRVFEQLPGGTLERRFEDAGCSCRIQLHAQRGGLPEARTSSLHVAEAVALRGHFETDVSSTTLDASLG